MIRKDITGFIIIIWLSPVLYCQNLIQDTPKEIVDHQIQALSEQSDNIFGKDIRLVNGRIYFPPNPLADGHPYFKIADWTKGSVTLNGKTFTGIKLNYDIYNDHLLFLDESQGGLKIRILLNKNQVTTFKIEDHTFIRLDLSYVNHIPERQYFEVLYRGEVSLFKKWTKQFEAIARQDYPYGRYSNARVTNYILKDDELFKFNSKPSLIKILGDQRDRIKKYISENRIRIRKATDQEMVELFKYYNSLIP